jgi:hypothetical protein
VELNVNLPVQLACLMRAEYAYDGRRGHGEFVPVLVFGASSVPGRALGFHAMTDGGAMLFRLPICALVHKADAPDLPLDVLELWDCLGATVSAIEFEYLRGLRLRTVLKDRQTYDGEYLFTLDWWGSAIADAPGDGGHKCAHVIKLDNGCFAAQPNNRILWFEPSFVTRPHALSGTRPDYLVNTRVWKSESMTRWATEHTDRQFYDIREEPCTTGKASARKRQRSR